MVLLHKQEELILILCIRGLSKMDSAQLMAVAQAGFVPPILIGLAIWNSDKVLSEDGAKRMYSYINDTSESPSQSKISDVIESFLESRFSPGSGFIGFAVNVFILTCISLLIFLTVYTSRTAGFYSYLSTPGFIKQFIGNGFIVTYLTNFFILFTYPLMLQRFAKGGFSAGLLMVLVDQLGKVLLFLLFTIITYFWFADIGGAFGGSKMLALKAVPETILLGLKFGNLTSAYIYSLLLSSFPLFIVLFIKLMATSEKIRDVVKSLLFWLPFKNKPFRVVGCIFAVSCGIFTVLISVVLNLIPMR